MAHVVLIDGPAKSWYYPDHPTRQFRQRNEDDGRPKSRIYVNYGEQPQQVAVYELVDQGVDGFWRYRFTGEHSTQP